MGQGGSNGGLSTVELFYFFLFDGWSRNGRSHRLKALVLGFDPIGDAWRIGIQSPRAASPGPVAQLSVQDQEVATSGDYLQAYSTDLPHHHILDPRTGYSNPTLASVSVMAPCVATADTPATTLMVLGMEAGTAFIQAYKDCKAMLVTKDLRTIHTAGFPRPANV